MVVQLAELVRYFPKHAIVGPGNAKLWGMDPAFDDWSERAVAYLRQNGAQVYNPIERYGTLEKRNDTHFSAAPENLRVDRSTWMLC